MEELIKNAIDIIDKMNAEAVKAGKVLKAMQIAHVAGNFANLAGIFEKGTIKESLSHLQLNELYEQLKRAFDINVAHLRLEFDKTFLEVCKQIGLNDVKGNSMDGFRIRGIIGVKINFTKSLSEISTFILSKKFNSLDPHKIAEKVKEEVSRLFERPFFPEDLLQSLYQAYLDIRKESSSVVLLKEVYRLVWLKKQKQEFLETANFSKMLPYTLDQFSIDLGRLIESKTRKTNTGYECVLSLGAGGINIYTPDGNFNSYKFLEFRKGGANV